MKTWLKLISALLPVLLLLFALTASHQEAESCCLCSSFRYHAPRLIDLKTGDLIELDLYAPHPTKVAELAEAQPGEGSFSFITFGTVSGYKDTANAYLELFIPTADKETQPALCSNCRSKLDFWYTGRYVLADLYSMDSKTLIPFTKAVSLTLRCYTISCTRTQDGQIKVTIQGNLD